MKRSKTVKLMLCSSLAIFGLGHMTGCGDDAGYYDDDGNWVATKSMPTDPYDNQYDGWEPAPVYVNGVMGVYDPYTHVFVAHSSPLFFSTCNTIRSVHIAESYSTVNHVSHASTVRGGFGAMGGHSVGE